MQIRIIAASALGFAAMAGAAICVAGYVANGIVYGSLVGLKGREQDLRTSRSHGELFLLGTVALQLVAAACMAWLIPRHAAIGTAAARFITGATISVAGTLLLFGLFVRWDRASHIF